MFRGCVAYDCPGTLVPVDGNINSKKYIDILGTFGLLFLKYCETLAGYFNDISMQTLIHLDIQCS